MADLFLVRIERAEDDGDHRAIHEERLQNAGSDAHGWAIGDCVSATCPRPLAVLANAIDQLEEEMIDEEEMRLAESLVDAARRYLAYWERKENP